MKGSMDRRIAESVDAKLKLTIMDKHGDVIFQEDTSIAGLEIVGNIKELYNWMVQIKLNVDNFLSVGSMNHVHEWLVSIILLLYLYRVIKHSSYD